MSYPRCIILHQRRSSFFNFGRSNKDSEPPGHERSSHGGGISSFFGGRGDTKRDSIDDDNESVLSAGTQDNGGGGGGGGAVSRRKSWFSGVTGKGDGEREINIKDILEIQIDYKTDTIQKALMRASENTNLYISPANAGFGRTKVLSIILRDDDGKDGSQRSVDFEIRESLWDGIYHALVTIVNYFKEVEELKRDNDLDI